VKGVEGGCFSEWRTSIVLTARVPSAVASELRKVPLGKKTDGWGVSQTCPSHKMCRLLLGKVPGVPWSGPFGGRGGDKWFVGRTKSATSEYSTWESWRDHKKERFFLGKERK